MTIAGGNFPELLWPGIHDLWGVSYEKYPVLYTKICETLQSTKAFEKTQGVTGLGLASVKDQGAAITYTDPFQGFQREYVMVTYSLGTTVTREMVEDEQYDYINKLPGFLAESMRQTEETTVWNHINRATNASYTGPDGLVLASASHLLVGGGTFSNLAATSADLSQTSLETGIQLIMDWVDDMSLKMRALPKCLVVPTGVNFTARKLMESAGVVGSADNDKNPIPGLFSDLVVSPWLTDADAWAIITDVPGLKFWRRRESEIVRDNEFDTQNLKIATTGRFASDWDDPRFLWYNPGA